MPILQYPDIAIGYTFAMLLLATITGAAVEIIQAIMRSRNVDARTGVDAYDRKLGLDGGYSQTIGEGSNCRLSSEGTVSCGGRSAPAKTSRC